ncbi:hypothetical protein LEP1GSC047_2955 [Leptospira inadai serovar Lyme str. 10]|uniref:Uncharacterized protein n=1 Tax=Leptospira inadai serovar Lyme str. 10 TaxID=1049790 RepID=V6HAI2_9LEPT|nr:hypothetical protein LEP1GSC047_2955 [Leptospira inadai serovar Lyme str. 10]
MTKILKRFRPMAFYSLLSARMKKFTIFFDIPQNIRVHAEDVQRTED